ncbi:MAG TPA: HAD domain-containing protein [Arthrobacter sp.]|nr:HAD domain-containing protein [Arthrobacter sp.]
MEDVTVYMDVDGVICPFGPAGRSEWGTEWCHADAGLLPVAYAQELVDGLNALAEAQDVRFVWLTSWEEMAPEYLCPAIGLDGARWPYLTAGGGNTGEGWWKLAALQADLERGNRKRVVWIDDQLRFEREAQRWARFLGARILLVSPDPRTGISPTELDSVGAFVSPPLF